MIKSLYSGSFLFWWIARSMSKYVFYNAVNAEIVKQNESKKVTNFLEFVSNNLYAIAFCVVAFSAAVAFLILRKKKSDDD